MKKFMKIGCGGIVVLFVLIIALALIGGEETPSTDTSSNSNTETNQTAETTDANSTPTETTVQPVTEEKADDVPREYKNALKKAELYASTMHMSKAGVYDQLISAYGEGFPVEAAQYAIENIQHDWNANALQKAKTYADTMAMSDSAIYDQLISEHGEKFTPEEAQYAIDNLQ